MPFPSSSPLAPTNVEKKAKCDNKNGEARGLIEMSISPDLMFHLPGINDSNEAWAKLEVVFVKHNVI
jgi:hypothetical protein